MGEVLHGSARATQAVRRAVRIFVAIDRTSKVAFAELHPRATRLVAADFLRRVLKKPPDKIPTVLPDDGVQFTLQPRQWFPGGHRFARICRTSGVEHRLTKPASRPPHPTAPHFLMVSLKTLHGLTPHKFVCAQWQKNLAIFTQDPTHLTLGLYT